jgi:hypothetical protein
MVYLCEIVSYLNAIHCRTLQMGQLQVITSKRGNPPKALCIRY